MIKFDNLFPKMNKDEEEVLVQSNIFAQECAQDLKLRKNTYNKALSEKNELKKACELGKNIKQFNLEIANAKLASANFVAQEKYIEYLQARQLSNQANLAVELSKLKLQKYNEEISLNEFNLANAQTQLHEGMQHFVDEAELIEAQIKLCRISTHLNTCKLAVGAVTEFEVTESNNRFYDTQSHLESILDVLNHSINTSQIFSLLLGDRDRDEHGIVTEEERGAQLIDIMESTVMPATASDSEVYKGYLS